MERSEKTDHCHIKAHLSYYLDGQLYKAPNIELFHFYISETDLPIES